METISMRIKQVFESTNLSQSDFARAISVTPAYIWKILNKEDANPSDRTISDICREFNVSEQWLRTGEGEMLVPLDDDVELIEIFAQIGQSEDDLIKRIIKGYWKLDEKEKAAIRKLIDSLCDK